ncbi:hypothetical protein [Celeribacter baekdonensis]|uniref:hypothetical protein n=1 Tax=Celeribacter baekdonensis TaxID=875171 RepID=UPI003A8DACFB
MAPRTVEHQGSAEHGIDHCFAQTVIEVAGNQSKRVTLERYPKWIQPYRTLPMATWHNRSNNQRLKNNKTWELFGT